MLLHLFPRSSSSASLLAGRWCRHHRVAHRQVGGDAGQLGRPAGACIRRHHHRLHQADGRSRTTVLTRAEYRSWFRTVEVT